MCLAKKSTISSSIRLNRLCVKIIRAGRWLADKPDTRFIFQPIFQP